jgi:putative transposase
MQQVELRDQQNHIRNLFVEKQSSVRFGTLFASKIRLQHSDYLRQLIQWKWHLDEVFVKINGETRYM